MNPTFEWLWTFLKGRAKPDRKDTAPAKTANTPPASAKAPDKPAHRKTIVFFEMP